MPRSIDSSGLTSYALVGGIIVANTSGNALTVALKTPNGNDPSPTEPMYVAVPAELGLYSQYEGVAITAPMSVTISQGSLLGTVANKPFRLWVYVVRDPNSNGYILALINFDSDVGAFNPIFLPQTEYRGIAVVADSGGGNADSACVYYSNVAVTQTFSYRVVGCIECVLGLPTPGNWSFQPVVTLYKNGGPLSGQIISSAFYPLTAALTNGGTIPYDDTIPLAGEGISVMLIDFVPSSPLNYLIIEAHVMCTRSVASNVILTATLVGASNTFAVGWANVPAADVPVCVSLRARIQVGGGYASVNEFGHLNIGGDIAGTTYINGISTGRKFGGVLTSGVRISEQMI
jgi:hypothetical protein